MAATDPPDADVLAEGGEAAAAGSPSTGDFVERGRGTSNSTSSMPGAGHADAVLEEISCAARSQNRGVSDAKSKPGAVEVDADGLGLEAGCDTHARAKADRANSYCMTLTPEAQYALCSAQKSRS